MIVHSSFDLAEIHISQSVIVEEFTVSLLQPDQVVSTENLHGDLLCESLECLPLMNIQGRHLARLGSMRKTRTTTILILTLTQALFPNPIR